MELIETLNSELNNISKEIQRPFVTLSYAQSLDGSIALERTEPLSLSSEESLHLTHQLRATHQALLVGIGTILSDDPRLTVRHADGIDPQIIVLDTSLRISADAKIFDNSNPPWIMVGDNIDSLQQKEQAKSEIDTYPIQKNQDGLINLEKVLGKLWAKGIKSLMVEGGAKVIQSFIKARLVDLIILTISPVYVGGLKAVGNMVGNGDAFPRLEDIQSARYGPDLVVWGKMDKHD